MRLISHAYKYILTYGYFRVEQPCFHTLQKLAKLSINVYESSTDTFDLF